MTRSPLDSFDEAEPVRLHVATTCGVRLGSWGARIPKDDRAAVCEMTSHLKPMPLHPILGVQNSSGETREGEGKV